jgi:hypothetical protein
MKNTFYFLIFMNIGIHLFAQAEDTIEEQTISYSLWDYHPLHLGGNLLRIGSATVEAPQRGNLTFQKNNLFLNMLVPVSKRSFFQPRVEWTQFKLDWNENPKFNQTHFNYIQFGLMFFTAALEDWRWILRADYNLNANYFSKAGTYGLFSGLIWGTNKWNDRWSYHIGATGYVGLKGDILYPLIGIDYTPNTHWLFRAIFPIDYAIAYKLDSHWTFALKARPLKERFRAGPHEPQPKSIFNYTSVGLEANIEYEIPMRLSMEIYGGLDFGGRFYIKNQWGKQGLYTSLGQAPYIGGKIDYGF